MIIAGSLLSFHLFSQEVIMKEAPLTLPTYKTHKPDVNPMFFKGESYQGASKVIYPYPLIDNLSNEKIQKDYTGLFLENEYIKLCITPEIGGKLYWAEDKTNDYNFFYKNNVVKPANIGMLGAWVSGGIEWCVIHHHRATTFMPVDYTLEEHEDGSKTIWFGETEWRHRMRWIIGITMFPGKSFFETKIKIYNRTPHTHSFLYWANVATHVNEDYQVFFPPSTDFGADHHKTDFTHWPVSHEKYRGIDYTEGVDISWWKNHPMPTSVFCHDLKEDFMGGYDHAKEAGTVHVGNHHIVKGAKLWEWGPGELAQMWDKVLSDEDGPYAEIMVGAYSDNQPDYSWIKPFETKTVSQYWYPVKDIGGIMNANKKAAVNFEVTDNKKVFFGFYATQKYDEAVVKVMAKGQSVYKKQVNINPAKPFTHTLTMPNDCGQYDLKVMLLASGEDEIISYQPVKKEYKEALPDIVEMPDDPEKVESIEELYLLGLRLKQFYNPKLDASVYFDEALKRDPGNINVNTFLGKECVRKGKLDEAKMHLRKAIDRVAMLYTRPEDCEAFYELGKVLKMEGNYEAAEDTLFRATWDYDFYSPAYQLLAEMACINNDYETALVRINNSLSTNTRNNHAKNLKVTVLRQLEKYDEAVSLAYKVLDDDPLNFYAGNELYLSLLEQDKKAEAQEIMNNMAGKMSDIEQVSLELAVDYLNSGRYDDAINVLTRLYGQGEDKKVNPLVHYYLGYLYDAKGEEDLASDHFARGGALPTDFCFPFRYETRAVLQKSMNYHADDARAPYYLGNLLFDNQPEKAMQYWKKAVEKDPGFAIAYRNLGWGSYHAMKDIPQAVKFYEQAISHNANDPVYFYELDKLYEINNTAPEKRLAMAEPHHEVISKRNDALLREIIVLNLNGKYAKAVDYLTNHHFHIREGDMRIRDINVNAHLLYGKDFFDKGNYEKALEQYKLANTFPKNQQVGRSLNDERVPQILYFIGTAYEALGEDEKAEQYYKQSVEQDIDDSEFKYYQGLAYLKLGYKGKADILFDQLISEGQKKLEEGVKVDVFAKFGEKKSENAILSMAHFKVGLGYLGKKQKKAAKEEIQKAVKLDVSNLWAQIME